MASSDKNIVITPNMGSINDPNIVFTGNANVPITLNVSNNNSLLFSASSSNIFSLTTSGNVGVGTGSPTGRLNVFGNISIANTTTISGVVFPDGTFQNTAASPGAFFSASNVTVTSTNTNATFYPAFVEATTGNIGIRVDTGFTYNPSTEALSLTGNLLIQNGGRFGNISVTNTTASTSTTTGALVVAGGVGVAGSMIAGGLVQGANVNVTGANLPTNGLYLPTTNTLGFATNSTEKMRLTSNGNLLLGGTVDNSFRLEVTNNNLGTASNSVIQGGRFTTSTSNADHLEILNVRSQAGGASWLTAGWRLQQKIDTTWMGYIQFNGSSSNVGVGTTNNYGITFGAGSTTANPNGVPEVMRITSSGLIGIGTAAPSTPLHVMGNIRISNTTVIGGVVFADGTFQNTAAASTPIPSGVNSASNVTVTSTNTNATFYPAFVEATTGNIGIRVDTGFTYNPSTEALSLTGNLLIQNGGRFGNISVTNTTASTSTTTGALVVAGGVGVAGSMFAGGLVQGANINVTGANLPTNGLYLPTTNTLGFVTNSTEKLRISATGGVSIGLTTNQNTLDVLGGVAVGNYAGNVAAGSNTVIVSGQVGIGTSNPSLRGTGTNLVLGKPNSDSGNWLVMNREGASNVGIGATSGYMNFIADNVSSGFAWITNSSGYNLQGGYHSMFMRGGRLFVGGNPSNMSAATSNIDVWGNQVIGSAYAGNVAAPTNGLAVQGQVGIGTTVLSSVAKLQVEGNLYVVNSSAWIGNLSVTNATASTSTTTGALIVQAGVGIGGALYVGGLLSGAAINGTSLYSSGPISAVGNASFANLISNGFVQGTSLYSSGPISAVGNARFANLISNGFVQGTSVYSSGPISAVGNASFANLISNGFVQGTSLYSSGPISTVGNAAFANLTSNGYVTAASISSTGAISAAGVITAASITSNTNVTVVNSAWVGNLAITNTTASTSTTTGAATIAGGLGVVGNVFAGRIATINSGEFGNVGINNTTVSTSTTSGALIVQGGIGVAGNIFAGRISTVNSGQFGNVGINNTTVSTSTTSGALTVAGGVGIANGAVIAGNVGIGTSSTTGYTNNVLAVFGKTYFNGNIYVTNSSTTSGIIFSDGTFQNTAALSSTTGTFSGAVTVTSASASALAVGLTGATNPAFSVDASTASQAAGLNVLGGTTTGAVALRILSSGATNNLTIDAKGTGTIRISGTSTGQVIFGTSGVTTSAVLFTQGLQSSAEIIADTNFRIGAAYDFYWLGRSHITSKADGRINLQADTGTTFTRLSFGTEAVANPALVFSGTTTKFRTATDSADAPITAAAATFSGAVTVTSASASALAVGLTGATNPAFSVDASTASQAAGLNVLGGTTTGAVALRILSSGATNNLTIDAKGTGTITLGGTSTGAITLTRATTMSAALTYGGVTLSNAVTGTGNMVLSASPTFTGTLTAAAVSLSGQLTSTLANNTATGGGQIYLNGVTGNRIDWNTNGVAAPAFTTRSAGTKLVLYPGVAVNAVDYAFGIDGGVLWSSVASTAQSFKWYGGTTLAATLSGAGALTLVGGLSATTGTFSGTLGVTGVTTHTGATTLSAALTYGGVTLSNSVTGTGSMVLSASPTFTGTAVFSHIQATGTGNDFNTGGVELIGNGATNTVYPNLGFHQPGLYASSIQLRAAADFRFYAQGAASYASITALNGTFAGTLGVTGVTTHTGATTLSAALTYGGVTLANSVTGTGSMVLSAGPTFTGTVTTSTLTATSAVDIILSSASTGTVQSGIVRFVGRQASVDNEWNWVAAGSGLTGAEARLVNGLWTGTAQLRVSTTLITLPIAINYGGVTLSNAVTGTGNMVLSASPTLTGTLSGAAASFTGEITAYSSDSRLKDNVNVITNALEKIRQLRGVSFDWNNKAADLGFTPENRHDVGVIAQELERVLPEAVRPAPFDRDMTDPSKSKSGENYLTVQYEKLTALLIEAIKEQQTMIDAHGARIAVLENLTSNGERT